LVPVTGYFIGAVTVKNLLLVQMIQPSIQL